jgi:hypothetical protein
MLPRPIEIECAPERISVVVFSVVLNFGPTLRYCQCVHRKPARFAMNLQREPLLQKVLQHPLRLVDAVLRVVAFRRDVHFSLANQFGPLSICDSCMS